MELARPDAAIHPTTRRAVETSAGRGWHVFQQLTERLSAGAWSPKDISADRYVHRIRAWDPADRDEPVRNEVVAKSAAQDENGWLDGYIPHGAVTTSMLEWELVEVDTSGTDDDTPTGKRENVLARWRQAIVE